jgi:putative Mg2+ transporter-C (MgtC) family protein
MLRPEELLIRLILAALLGSLIGIERERLDWAAGLRTHMLVCVGSTLFMIVSAFGFTDILGSADVTLDPSRIAAQVVTGVGFLGAGTIILRREMVRGLTTAASVWTVAAVGLAIGGGLYLAAISTTILVLIILAGIKPLKQRFFPRRRLPRLTLLVDRRETHLAEVLAAVEAGGLHVQQLQVERTGTAHQDRVRLLLRAAAETEVASTLTQLQALPGLRKLTQVR